MYLIEIGVFQPMFFKMLSLEICSNKTLNDPLDSKENSERHFLIINPQRLSGHDFLLHSC